MKTRTLEVSSRKAQPQKTAPAAVQTTPRPDTDGLTNAQIYLADLAGEVISHGADDDVVEPLVRALLRHSGRLEFREHASEPTDTQVENICRKLVRSWPERTEPETAQVTGPASAAAIVRSNVRARLISHLDEFARRATYEEAWMMIDTLMTWRSNSLGRQEDECVVAQAFEEALRQTRAAYIRVDERHEQAVRAFLHTLEAADVRAERRVHGKVA